MLEEWAIQSLSHARIWKADEQNIYRNFTFSCFWMFLHLTLCLRFLYNSCIFFGHGWMASLLHLFKLVLSACGFLLVLLLLVYWQFKFLFVTFCELFQATYLLSFSFLFSLLFSSLSVCISPFLYSLLSITPTPLPVHTPCSLPPRQTYPITRTITIKAKLWIKGMISPQWPMPWRGWVPLRLSQPCPAVPDPSPVCMTASCSAQAVKRPSSGWRWMLDNILCSQSLNPHYALTQCNCTACT